MSYEPSHRRAPRQERWPNATPGEGWPAYQQGDGTPPWEAAPAYAGSRNGYGPAGNGYGAASNGHGATVNDYSAGGNGYRDSWGGRESAQYSDPGQGYWASGNGGTTTAYPAVGEGYADGFDGAPDGYVDGYGGAADGYGAAEDFYETPDSWDDYTQPGHEFTGSAGYLPQDEYPALDPASSVLVAPDTMGEWWREDQSRDGGRDLGHRGAIVGVTMGILAAAVAIGVATLAAAFVRPQASPVSAVGGVFIDRIPATLRAHLMAHFGAHGQTVLLLGVIAIIAIVLGFMAQRNVSVGVAGLAALGLLGAFVAITRPESRASDVIPSVIGALAGIVAMMWLARASAPTPRAASSRPAYGNGRRRAR